MNGPLDSLALNVGERPIQLVADTERTTPRQPVIDVLENAQNLKSLALVSRANEDTFGETYLITASHVRIGHPSWWTSRVCSLKLRLSKETMVK